jgi:hypothetical protein
MPSTSNTPQSTHDVRLPAPRSLVHHFVRSLQVPPSYVRSAAALILSIRSLVSADFPLDLVDQILMKLPQRPDTFLDAATLQRSLPRRDYRVSSGTFAVLARLY